MRKALEGDEASEDTRLWKTSNGFHSRVLLKERLDPPHRERCVHVRTTEITFTSKHRMFCTKKKNVSFMEDASCWNTHPSAQLKLC